MRLETFLSHSGAASRRAAKKLILSGAVSVNGEVSRIPSSPVSEKDEVRLFSRRLKLEERKLYILLYKPRGYVSSSNDEKGRACAIDLLKGAYGERLYSVGRLDMYSEGLLIFTNDGEFAKKTSHPSSGIEKEYLVRTSSVIPEKAAREFARGIVVEGVRYKAKSAELESGGYVMRVVLQEGKNREIRRVFEHFSLKIVRLIRVRIGSITAGRMKSGEFRALSEEELGRFSTLAEV